MGIESFFRRKPVAEKTQAQDEHDKKTKREAGMIGMAALAAVAGAGATYEKIPDLQAASNGVDRTAETTPSAKNDLPGGVSIEKNPNGQTIITVPTEKGSVAQKSVNIELNEQPVHINLDEHRERVDSIEY